MELKHQLTPHLKRLRLSGVLETLDARHRQAIDGKWSYVEFLERLLEDEVERRSQKQLQLRLRRSGVNTTKSLESFDFNFNPTINRQKILGLAACDYIRERRNLIPVSVTDLSASPPLAFPLPVDLSSLHNLIQAFLRLDAQIGKECEDGAAGSNPFSGGSLSAADDLGDPDGNPTRDGAADDGLDLSSDCGAMEPGGVS